MRTLYLIFSHEHQKQLYRLVTAISRLSSNAVVAIHHDPSKIPFENEFFSGNPDVNIIPDAIPGEWGDFSLVEQYLYSIEWCMANLDFDWLVTLTGLSYPIMPLHEFEHYLEQSEFDAFVYHFDAFDPIHWPTGTGANRYLYAYLKVPRNPYYYKVPAVIKKYFTYLRFVFNKVQPFFRIISPPRNGQMRLGIRRWRFPFDKKFKICGGRQMLNLNRHAINKVFNYINNNPKYIDYARRTFIPDESFFTSIVANDTHLMVCNDVLRYIKWPNDKIHASSGDVITSSDVKKLLHSGKPFGLKFDSRIDVNALDMVDKAIGLKTNK